MNPRDRLPTDGGAPLGQNPFGSLDPAALKKSGFSVPDRPMPPPKEAAAPKPPAPKNRGRVEIRRETQGRGGKTVTVVSGFVGIGLPEKESLAKKMQKACGAGGTVKDGAIEIQGDKREMVARILEEAGFRPVLAGG
jgi:translation initiation factor 1